jgi:short-subunit dehydrogenase
MNINIGTPLKLVHAFSTRLVGKKQPGGILLMSSLAGLLGMQYIAPYAASKAFTWNLAESLHHELKPHKIDVMACIAGATATEAYLGTKPQYGFIKPQVQQPSDVAELALKKLGKRALFIPGFSNRFNYFILTRLLPRKMASYFANKTMKSMYPNL